jgi:hypothetical protein
VKPQLVMLCGTARAGKDSMAEALSEQMWMRGHANHTLRLGDLVRQEVAQATGVPVEDQLAARDGWRRVWQFWGTEVRRQLCDDNYWLKLWKHYASLLGRGTSLLVPDVRFTNELQELKDWAYAHGREPRVVVVRRSRMWELWQFRRRSRLHKSEREWRRWVWYYKPSYVKNTGSLVDLDGVAEDLVGKWSTE